MIEKIKNNILPLLFGTVVSSTVLYFYHNKAIVWLTVLAFLFQTLLFFLFDKLKKQRVFGGILYTILFIVILIICGVCILSGKFSNEISITFKQWFYIAQTKETFCLNYSIALFIGGVFFISSVLYYFTQIIYRGLGTLLILLIPFILVSKREDIIPNIYIILILISYFGVMVHNRQMKSEAGVKVISNPSYIMSVSIFVGIVVAITMIIPKPKVISVQERNSEFFDQLFATNINIGGTGLFSGQTSNAPNSGNNYLSNKILFYIDSSQPLTEPLYLRNNVFDYYAAGKWNKQYLNKEYAATMYKNIDDWNTYQVKNYSLMKKVANNSAGENVQKIKITANAQTSGVVIAPLWVMNITNADFEIKKMYNSEIYSSTSWKTYDIQYCPETLKTREEIRELGWTQADLENYLSENISVDQSLEAVRTEYENAKKYYSNKDDIVSANVSQLAKDITKDCISDYDKAYAIEQYFTKNNFKYDLSYVPQDSSVDTFLFYGKTGICSDFASAMTILAREAGLPARYVEGYLVYEKGEDGRYIVRELHTHAFTEVYISGSGWVTFEPTVAGFMNTGNKSENLIWQYIQVALKGLIIVALVLMLLSILFLKRLVEWIFRTSLKRKDNKQAIVYIYKHIVHIIEHTQKISLNNYTPTMLQLLIKKIYDYDIQNIINVFEATLYGQKEVTNTLRQTIYSEYISLYNNIEDTKKGSKKICRRK